MELEWAYYTSKGRRKNNEDFLYADKIGNHFMAAIADGLGGNKDGNLASQCAVLACVKGIINDKSSKKLVNLANEEVLKLRERIFSNTKTTINLCVIDTEHIDISYVGDSRLYAFKRNDKSACIVWQSTDHSVSQMMVDAGEIKPVEIRFNENRNRLTKALGNEELDPSSKIIQNEEIDVILMCTDGFWEYITEQEMISCLCRASTASQWLELMKNIHDKNVSENCDNNTAISIFLSYNSEIKSV